MPYEIIDIQSKLSENEFAQTLYKSDVLSYDLFKNDTGYKLIVHQREYEIHNKLSFLVLKGKIKICIEDKEVIVGTQEIFVVQDIYMFEVYFEEPSVILYSTTGESKINHLGEYSRELIKRLEKKDIYTKEHNVRVGKYATQIMHVVDPSYHSSDLDYAARFHDVGKINVPEEILNKPGKYTEEEYNVMKKHPQDSYDFIMQELHMPNVATIALQHQERLDGSGYPNHLTEKEILKEAKIIMVADVFDALTTNRSYRSAYSVEEALKIIQEEVDNHKLDRQCYEALADLVKKGTIKVSDSEE